MIKKFLNITQEEFNRIEVLINEEAKMLTGLVAKRTNAPLNSKQ